MVESGDWLAGRSLAELALPKEGVLVLGVERAATGKYLGAPTGDTVVAAGDTLILYGQQDTLTELDQREAGGDKEFKRPIGSIGPPSSLFIRV
jgi:uncharacterized protein with PhoU and TrkA domain